jgi:hypothetical protein
VRLLGTEFREIAALSTAPDFVARHDNEHTLKVIKRVQHGADVPVPVVTTDQRLAWGEAVIAAHHALQTKHCYCKIVECSEDELVLLRKLDAAKGTRIQTRGEELQLVTLTEPDVLRRWMREGTTLVHEGRAKKLRVEAREWVAAILEVEPRSIAALEYKGKKKPAEPAWSLACHSWPPAPGLCEEAASVRAAVDNVDQRLRQDQRELAQLKALPGVERLHEAVHKLAAHVRSLRPAHLCPYCKSTVAVRPTCLACQGAGWVSEETWQRAPEELRNEYLVSHGGQLLDPHTMQVPRRIVRRHVPQSAQFVGDSYDEEEEPPEDDEGVHNARW